MLKIRKNIVSGQSKGCALAIQVGTTVWYWKPKWAKPRTVAIIHAEIDTPIHRLRIGFYAPWGKYRPTLGAPELKPKKLFTIYVKRNNQHGNTYRDRWLKKLGHTL